MDYIHEDYMRIALTDARAAYDSGEIPVGAAIIHNGNLIAVSGNSNRGDRNPVKHAEIKVIEIAAEYLKNERLTGCDLYVTKEPCSMCAGAIVHARIKRVFIGCRDLKSGACGTVLEVCGNPALNHRPEIIFGILEEECSMLMKTFFKEIRNKKVTADN